MLILPSSGNNLFHTFQTALWALVFNLSRHFDISIFIYVLLLLGGREEGRNNWVHHHFEGQASFLQ